LKIRRRYRISTPRRSVKSIKSGGF
jgi:hypothetical protein